MNPEDIYDPILIPSDGLFPLFTPGFTEAPTSSPDAKRPDVWRLYDPDYPNSIQDHILDEAKVCEHLKQHAHPSIAEYRGCEVRDGKITGLCFTRYEQTLMERVNPGHLNKHISASERSGKPVQPEFEAWLTGIESGIRYLHSLGIVHNDINPSNVIFQGEKPILIDFGSCRLEGSGMVGFGLTYEWHDENIKNHVVRTNDLDALHEIRAWLFGRPDEFKFAN